MYGHTCSPSRANINEHIEQFKKVISKIWDEMPIDHVRAASDSFEKRLKLVIKNKGGAFPANIP